MEKVTLSALLSVVIGGVVVAGIYVRNTSQEALSSSERLAAEVSAVHGDLRAALEETRALARRVQRLEAYRPAFADEDATTADSAAVPAVAAEGASRPVPARLSGQEDLRAFIFATIEEERTLRDQEREQQREEMRERFEERRQEIAAFSEGPYDRYNLKVNSLAKVLELTDAQKSAYYQLVQQQTEKVDQAREKWVQERRAREAAAREAAAAGGADGAAEGAAEEGRDRRRGPFGRGEDREGFREIYETAQQEFAAAVPQILTVQQAEIYSQLSSSAQSFQGTGYVGAPGEEGGGAFGRFPGGAMPDAGRGGGFGEALRAGGRMGGGRTGGGRGGR